MHPTIHPTAQPRPAHARRRTHAAPALIPLSALALAAALLGCEPMPSMASGDAGVDGGAPAAMASEAPIGERADAIHGAPSFVGCTAAQRDALEDALDFARDRVVSGDYRDCLGDAFGVEAEGRMVEELIADTNTWRSTEFRCVAGPTGANAGFDANGEHMNIVGDLTTTETTAGLAAIIVHEITHNHGWWHNTFYGPTWPDQVQTCVFRGQPFGARRSEVAGPRALTTAGGAGGTERSLRCGSDEAMVGIAGAVGNGRLTRLQPVCQDVDGGNRVGSPWNFGMSLPAGSVRFEDHCPAGYGVIGLEGSADAFVERVRVVCGRLSQLRAMSGGVAISARAYRGRLVGWGYSRRCPTRTVATGMTVRTGALVDGFELECDDFPLDNRSGGVTRGSHGGWGGSPTTRRCPGTMALTGVFGQWALGGGSLATMGGRCKPMTDQGVARGTGWGWSIAHTEVAGRVQPTEDDAILRTSYCADGEVLVGLAVSADGMVGDASALCADSEAWLAGDDTTRQASGVRRRPGETIERITCAPGEVGVALSLRHGWLIDRAGLVCAAPDPVGSLRHVPAEGGNGGNGYEEICPEGRPMVGLRTDVDGGLTLLAGRCGRATDWGTSTVGATDLPTVRGTDAVDAIDDCPQGQVMVGLGVAHGPRLAEWVKAICADEQTVRDGDDPAVVHSTPWRGAGGEWHTLTDLRCRAGEVVRGLHGRRGSLQDSVGPVCGKVTLLPGDVGRGGANPLRPEVHPLMIPAGFGGRVRLQLSGDRFLHARVRVRKGAAPGDGPVHAEGVGANGLLWLDVDGLTPGRWFIEVTPNAGLGGSYSLSVVPR